MTVSASALFPLTGEISHFAYCKMSSMLLGELVEASAAVTATPARNEKVAVLAALLARAEPADVAAAVSWLSGALTQRQIGVGWALLREPPAPAPERSLTVAELERAFAAIGAMSGPGSVTARRDAVRALLARADAAEQEFLGRLLLGDLGQGALAGVMTDAVARAAAVPATAVRRALMLHGNLAAVAAIALRDGRDGLAALRLQVGRPLAPMLAGTAADVEAALAKTGPAAVDWKLDGARLQVHRDGDDVALFTRTLDDVTARLPEVVAAARALPVRSIVLDGEAIALRADGRPEPFQVTAARFGTRGARAKPLASMFFDVLHLDGADLLDEPLHSRLDALERVAAAHRMPGAVRPTPEEAAELLERALEAGHEGVMVKSLTAPYAAGRRGRAWQKVKPVHTLDLVVLGAEWGYGRRTGSLSNIHLGARDPDGGEPIMVGKTFKGMTDELLAWQTATFPDLAREEPRGTEAGGAGGAGRHSHEVLLRPELVVEIELDGVQRSPRYPGGVALRFARVLRYRPDKTPAEADTIDAVRALLRE
jgi:DNA ligase 1